MSFSLDQRLAQDSFALTSWALSDLRLMNDRRYVWLILVPRRPKLRELFELTDEDQKALMTEISRAGRLLQFLFQPDKINIAALGNIVAQLHVHVIARHIDDFSWPQPVWGRGTSEPYESHELKTLTHKLRALV